MNRMALYVSTTPKSVPYMLTHYKGQAIRVKMVKTIYFFISHGETFHFTVVNFSALPLLQLSQI